MINSEIINKCNSAMVITSEIIKACNSPMIFEESIEEIEVNIHESEYYKCLFALNNLPYNLKKLTVYIFTDMFITRNGDIFTNMNFIIEMPGFVSTTVKYTFAEFKKKLKIPYECELVMKTKFKRYGDDGKLYIFEETKN